MQILLRGSQGEDVRTAQAALNFYAGDGDLLLDPDGKFGTNTHNRTVQFQRQNGLFDDGKIGDKTRAVLYNSRVASLSATLTRPVPKPSLMQPRPPGAINLGVGRLTLQPIVAPRPVSLFWPPLQLTLPGMPSPVQTRNVKVPQGLTLTMPPLGPTPFAMPGVEVLMLQSTFLSLKRPLTLKSEVESLRDEEGEFKLGGFIMVENAILPTGLLDAKFFIKAKAELAPNSGGAETTIGTGVKVKLFRGAVELSAGVNILRYDFQGLKVESKGAALFTELTVVNF